MAAVELEEVKKSYGNHEVLKGVSFKVEEGEIFGLLGPNGVGKTTLFQTVLGLLRQESGEIKIDGERHDRGKEIKRKIGYLPSDISFYESMTARQNLELFAELAETEPDFNHLLDLVGLSDDAEREVKEFSTGMKKRLGIAQSLIKDPEIIIYDEPTTGLDPEGKRNFRRHVEKINDEKDKTVIISSHITTEIEPLCDRFGILFDGEIVASGTKAELGSETGKGVRLHVEARNHNKLEEVLRSESIEFRRKGNAFVIEIEEDKRSEIFETLIEKGVEIESFDLEEETLETAYLRLTGGV